MDYPIIDLFAGHGWDVAARSLGLPDPLGIEWDDAACATRAAADMPTLKADIAALNPLDFGPVVGFIASPPCQAWSTGGKNLGKLDKPDVIQCALDMSAGVDTRHIYEPHLHDARSLLVVEPLRWTLALRPDWACFEQVPPVIGLWRLFAGILRGVGYSVDVGLLNAEQYGVPQTRKRAFLIAKRRGTAKLTAPTHEKYVKGVERGHTPLLPWISMADALGLDDARAFLRTQYGTGGNPADRRYRDVDEPAWTTTSKFNRNFWGFRANSNRPNTAVRRLTDPAPTLASGHHPPRWVYERPSTAVCADPRIMAPGRHDPKVPGSQMHGAIRVSVAEAATLQSYPNDFPFRGTKTQIFQQIGNAVPPLLAKAVLEAAT